MLQRLVANWLRQHAQDALMSALNPDVEGSRTTEGGEDSEELQRAQIVCFFPSAGEAGGVVDQLADVSVSKCNGFVERVGRLDDKAIAIVESALPHETLAPAIRDVIQLRQPKWVLSSGFAVSISERAKRGSIVVASSIVDEHDYSLNTGTNMPEAKGLYVGELLTRVAMPTSAEKKELAGSGNANKSLAVETQAAVIAEVSRILKVPMMAMHCVAQGLNERQSSVLNQLKTQDSFAGVVGAAAGALLDQPGSVKEFWTDKEATIKNSDRLAKFLVGIIRQL